MIKHNNIRRLSIALISLLIIFQTGCQQSDAEKPVFYREANLTTPIQNAHEEVIVINNPEGKPITLEAFVTPATSYEWYMFDSHVNRLEKLNSGIYYIVTNTGEMNSNIKFYCVAKNDPDANSDHFFGLHNPSYTQGPTYIIVMEEIDETKLTSAPLSVNNGLSSDGNASIPTPTPRPEKPRPTPETTFTPTPTPIPTATPMPTSTPAPTKRPHTHNWENEISEYPVSGLKEVTVFKCDYCDYSSTSTAEMLRHQSNNLGSSGHTINDIKDVSYEDIYGYKCDSCDYATQNESDIKAHVNTHLSGGHQSFSDIKLRAGDYSCVLCPSFTSTDEAVIAEHVMNNHTKYDGTAINFTDLYKTVNDKFKPELITEAQNQGDHYVCKHCDFSETTISGIETHLNDTHSLSLIDNYDISTTLYTCKTCENTNTPYSTYDGSYIIKHYENTHNMNFDELYTKVIVLSTDYVITNNVTDVDAYKCDVVDCGFVTTDANQKQVHTDATKLPGTYQSNVIIGKNEIINYKYQCMQCDNWITDSYERSRQHIDATKSDGHTSYSTSTIIEESIEWVTGNTGRYICSSCGAVRQ